TGCLLGAWGMCCQHCRHSIAQPQIDAHTKSLPRGLPLFILLLIVQNIVLLVLVSILNGVVQLEKVVLLLVVLPFIEAFQRRFKGLHVLLLLNVLERRWDARCLGLLLYGGERSRKVKGLLDCWHGMTQAKV